MVKSLNTSVYSLIKNRIADKHLALQSIIKDVEKGTELKLSHLKKIHSDKQLFLIALNHVTTTKKAVCTALDIPIETACWFKSKLEKDGILVQSFYKVICPYSNYPARLLSTNPKEFERLQNSISNQLKLF